MVMGPSAFFGTNLVSVLVPQGVDTVVLCGATTSGCIRAIAIDLLQYGYPTLVPHECVGEDDLQAATTITIVLIRRYGMWVASVEVPTLTRCQEPLCCSSSQSARPLSWQVPATLPRWSSHSLVRRTGSRCEGPGDGYSLPLAEWDRVDGSWGSGPSLPSLTNFWFKLCRKGYV